MSCLVRLRTLPEGWDGGEGWKELQDRIVRRRLFVIVIPHQLFWSLF
jgi:hypothetical protein